MCVGPFRRVCHWGPLTALGKHSHWYAYFTSMVNDLCWKIFWNNVVTITVRKYDNDYLFVISTVNIKNIICYKDICVTRNQQHFINKVSHMNFIPTDQITLPFFCRNHTGHHSNDDPLFLSALARGVPLVTGKAALLAILWSQLRHTVCLSKRPADWARICAAGVATGK